MAQQIWQGRVLLALSRQNQSSSVWCKQFRFIHNAYSLLVPWLLCQPEPLAPLVEKINTQLSPSARDIAIVPFHKDISLSGEELELRKLAHEL